ncbi:hypothetical protein [Neisseria sp.]|uniref:hypothetical protein n=1 Tax=Neisseria sp. TaxID=192066 RepID=UPI00359FCCE0
MEDFSKPGEDSISLTDPSTWADQFDYFYHMRQLPESQLSALRVLIRCLMKFFKINELDGHKEFALSGDVRTCPASIAMEKIVESRKEFGPKKP